MKFPRVFVVSNNCFSQSNSNGRTLGNFFKGWEIENIGQFYIQNEIPDSSFCNNYFRVTDIETLRAFIKGCHVGRRISLKFNEEVLYDKIETSQKKKRKKTPFTSILRDIIWNSNRWQSPDFIKWIDEFKPQLVLIQAGDAAFMLKLATDIAQKRKIPLVIYNSESYYFKDKNYMRKSGISSLLYPIFHKRFKKQFEKTIVYSSLSIYNCQMLQEVYNKKFKHANTVIMTSTEIVIEQNKKKNIIPIISYIGNLGVGRHEPLIKIANALQQINLEFYLDIYGKIPNDEVKIAIKSCKGIRYNGFIPYNEVVKVMQNSDLLVHAENFSNFYQWDLKYAFSTKIADSLTSGTCFFLYAPEGLACTQYLLQSGAACVVTTHKNLKLQLTSLLKDERKRNIYISNARKVVALKHDSNINQKRFQYLLCQIIKENKYEDSTSKLCL